MQKNVGSDQKPNSWFYSLLFTAYMRKYPAHVTSVQGRAQNTLYITWRSKQKVFYDKEFTTVTTHKKIQNYYN